MDILHPHLVPPLATTIRPSERRSAPVTRKSAAPDAPSSEPISTRGWSATRQPSPSVHKPAPRFSTTCTPELSRMMGPCASRTPSPWRHPATAIQQSPPKRTTRRLSGSNQTATTALPHPMTLPTTRPSRFQWSTDAPEGDRLGLPIPPNPKPEGHSSLVRVLERWEDAPFMGRPPINHENLIPFS